MARFCNQELLLLEELGFFCFLGFRTTGQGRILSSTPSFLSAVCPEHGRDRPSTRYDHQCRNSCTCSWVLWGCVPCISLRHRLDPETLEILCVVDQRWEIDYALPGSLTHFILFYSIVLFYGSIVSSFAYYYFFWLICPAVDYICRLKSGTPRPNAFRHVQIVQKKKKKKRKKQQESMPTLHIVRIVLEKDIISIGGSSLKCQQPCITTQNAAS
jgi:hypothetical protein